jgi:cytochrome c5
MNRLLKLGLAVTLLLVLGSCGESNDSAPEPVADIGAAEADAPTADTLTARQMQQWSDSCALCHVTGVADAPVIGNSEQWQARQAQGKDVLLAHTLEGFNSMPPLGYCMSCETDDFSAMIDFMIGDLR